MNASPQKQKDRIWELIEVERSRDLRLRRISTGAWAVTFAALLFTAVGIGFDVWRAMMAHLNGRVGMDVVFREAMPFVWVAGGIALLVAVLSSAGVLLRLRAASLDEIRLRLAAVEQMLADEADTRGTK